jgi:hypothetical protein
MCRGAAANAKEGCKQLAKQTAITTSKMKTNRTTDSPNQHQLHCRRAFSRHVQDKRTMLAAEAKKAPEAITPRGQADCSSALAWLSLIGLLASRAQLRFTKQP